MFGVGRLAYHACGFINHLFLSSLGFELGVIDTELDLRIVRSGHLDISWSLDHVLF